MIRLLLLALLAACVLAPSADAAKRTCRSGETVYREAGVRVFEDGRGDDRWFACGPRTRRPVELFSTIGGYGFFKVFGRSGDKVLFEGSFSGEGGGEDTWVGWFDGRTSQLRSGELAGDVSNDPLDAVVAADGSVGVAVAIEHEFGLRVGYLARGKRKGTLTRELALAAVPGYARGSLAFGDRTLGWTLADGQARSVPLTGETVTCTSGTTLAESDGARVFEVLAQHTPGRRSQADVLAACTRGATAPRELAVTSVSSQNHWEVRSLRRAGSRTAFVAGSTGVVLLDAGELRFHQPKEISHVSEVAIAATGQVVFAGSWSGGGGGTWYGIGRLNADGWEALATQGGELAPESLAVGDDARVTWTTKDGVAQAVPLAGETAIGCGSGTTRLDHDGLRVFEVLPAGAEKALLYACAPGATAPVLLHTGPRASSWNVTELARENGKLALYAGTLSVGVGDRVISLDAGAARGAFPRLAVGTIVRDGAVAADGRVALALEWDRRWQITVFTVGGPGALKDERRLARPADGVQPGSLAFSADGSRVTWRNRAGAERSARV